MKILHVIHSLDPRSGGPSHALYELSRAQVDQGNSVSIIASDRQSGEQWFTSSDYLNFIKNSLPDGLTNLSIIPSYGRYRPWVRYAYSPQCTSFVYKALGCHLHSSPTIDFVHVHGLFSQITQKATDICGRLKIPYAVRPTGALDALPLKRGFTLFKRIFLRYLLKNSLEKASFVHATSESEARSLKKLNFDLKLKSIPLGVTVPNWDPKYYQSVFHRRFPGLKGKRIVLCLSRIHPIKRLGLALEAFKNLRLNLEDCQLVIAGTPTKHQQSLEKLANALGVSDHVHFTGFLSKDLKTGAFFSSSVFLQTSEHENFGLGVMESMAHGLRVVCTKGVAAGKHVASSQGGLFVSDTPEAVAHGLCDVMNNHPSPCDLNLARRVSNSFSWDAIAKQLDVYYRHSTQK